MNLKNFIFPLGIILLTITLIAGNLSLFSFEISPEFLYLISAILIFAGIKFEKTFAFPLILILVSSNLLSHKFNFLQGPEAAGILIACFLIFLLIDTRKYNNLFLLILLTGFIIKIIYTFVSQSNGHLLTSDDHASFYYRIRLLINNFPNIPFYNPLWNAGWDQRDFFATGSLSLFFISLPFDLIFSPTTAYNYTIIFILIIIAPAVMFSSARMLGFSPRSSFISTILALANGLVWYRWGIKFGTMGFVISCALFPIVFTLSLKLAKKELSVKAGIVYIISSTLMLFWTPSAIVLIPVGIYLIATIHKWISRRNLIICLLIIIVNLPVMLMLIKVSKVGNFLATNNTTIVFDNLMNVEQIRYKTQGPLTAENIFKPLTETFLSCNPLIWLLIVPALLTAGLQKRKIFIASIVWLLILGTVVTVLKPQLELDRMLVFLLYISTIPVGFLLSKETSRVNTASINSILLVSLLTVCSIFQNRTWEVYDFEGEKDKKLVEEIKALKPNGRILLSGFIQHNYGYGHLALLPDFTGYQFIASSPYHNLWSYTQVFPNEVLVQNEAGIKNYLSNLNVEYVLAHERFWIEKFRTYSWLEEIPSTTFKMFRIKDFVNNSFIDGTGKVTEITDNQVKFNLESDSAILKFRYFSFLSVPGCTLSPEKLPGLNLTKISNCKNKTDLVLKSVTPLERLFK